MMDTPTPLSTRNLQPVFLSLTNKQDLWLSNSAVGLSAAPTADAVLSHSNSKAVYIFLADFLWNLKWKKCHLPWGLYWCLNLLWFLFIWCWWGFHDCRCAFILVIWLFSVDILERSSTLNFSDAGLSSGILWFCQKGSPIIHTKLAVISRLRLPITV